MPESIEAVYQNGVLKPLETIDLKEDRHYRLIVEEIGAPDAPEVQGERTGVRAALRATGLLAELGPNLKAMADPTISVEDVIAAMDRAGGPSLSEISLKDSGTASERIFFDPNALVKRFVTRGDSPAIEP